MLPIPYGQDGKPLLAHGNYSPSYLRQIVEHMQRGYSFISFAGVIGIPPRTLYGWAERIEEVKLVKEIGEGRRRLMLEGIVLDNLHNPDLNDRLVKNLLANVAPDDYRQREDHNIKADVAITVISNVPRPPVIETKANADSIEVQAN